MPLVHIYYKKPTREFGRLIQKLAWELPEIIAEALDASNQEGEAGCLGPGDIEVKCFEGGMFDVNTKDIEIVIWAHEFPSRQTTLEQRKEKILGSVRKFLSDYDRNVQGFVWVLLSPSAFGTL